MKLTTIKNLLGRQGGHFLLFGLLTRMEDGEFYLEDLDDKVKLNLDAAVRFLLSFLPFLLELTPPLRTADSRIRSLHRRLFCSC
jgi:hypothetical protein